MITFTSDTKPWQCVHFPTVTPQIGYVILRYRYQSTQIGTGTIIKSPQAAASYAHFGWSLAINNNYMVASLPCSCKIFVVLCSHLMLSV